MIFCQSLHAGPRGNRPATLRVEVRQELLLQPPRELLELLEGVDQQEGPSSVELGDAARCREERLWQADWLVDRLSLAD